MAYLRPPLFVRKVFNPLAMRFGIGGAVTLTTMGRRSGKPSRIPVIPIEHEGARYLVSTRGESPWVHNLRAAGTGELEQKGQRTRFRSSELPVDERPPIIAAYRAKVGREVNAYFSKLPDAKDHPVFRIDADGA
jgi:deazaflavin-dependent oxidoreductase (nitroreductase family)